MSAAPASPTNREAQRLCVFVACHAFVCAIAASSVVRLVLPDDVELIHARGARGRALDGTAVVIAGDEVYAAWDLSLLLEVPPLASAFVLLRVPDGAATIPIALRTGPCLRVGEIGAAAPLPAPLFRARPGAIAGAFSTAADGAVLGVEIGLELDPRRLFTAPELDASRATLLRAESARAQLAGSVT